MKLNLEVISIAAIATLGCGTTSVFRTLAAEDATGATASSDENTSSETADKSKEQAWNWHIQNTDSAQGYPGFFSKYSGPNSLPSGGETRETVSFDLMAGVRLCPGAEAHNRAKIG